MQNPNLSVQQRLNMAMQLMHKGQFEQALTHFQILKNVGIKDFRLSRAMGSAYERLNNNTDAKRYFSESLLLNPKQPDLYYALGKIAYFSKAFEQAVNYFKQCLSFDNKNPQVWLKLGQTYFHMDELQLAEQAFFNCEKLQVNSLEAKLGRSRILQKRNEHKKAEELLIAIDKIEPNNLRVLSELGWLQKDQGNYRQAAELFKKRLTIEPANPEYYEDLALVYLDLHQPVNAMDTLKQGIQKSPDNRKLNQLFSALKYEMNEDDHLSHYRQQAIDKMSDELIADYIVGLVKIDEVAKAKQLVNELFTHADKKGVAKSLQLILWEKEQKHDDIVGYFRDKISSKAVLSISENEKLVKAYLAIGENHKANKLIDNMLQLAPNDQLFWALKTTALRQLQSPEYEYLCDYQNMVFQQPIILPNQYENIEQFSQALRVALNEIHVSQRNPLDQSLRHGTQTMGNLFAQQVPIIQQLRGALKSTIDSLLVDLKPDKAHPFYQHAGKAIEFSANWSVKLSNQGFHVSHVHPKGWLSSAFYVHVPSVIDETSKQGWLHFGKPGIALPDTLAAHKWVKPQIGQLVLFPSYFWHGTEAFEDSQERMSVAFDLLPIKSTK
ncbi:MAG: putative 2OG-Fe(II) oxygenase [Aliiglaciecola sp.]|uniref:2OG-Fe(II) oxygenase family protein n=1 Tax=Aliiglaciecola sp. TaxID=1872441 RepID=UPI003298134B